MPVDISNFPWANVSRSEPEAVFEAQTLGQKTIQYFKNLHRFTFELTTIPMKPDTQGREVEALLARGKRNGFTFVHPKLSFTRGTEPAEGIVSNNSYASGLDTIALTSAGAWQLVAGDYITIEGSNKVYKVANTTALQSGTQTIELAYPLMHNVDFGAEINVNNVTFYLVSSSTIESDEDADNGQLIETTFIFKEDF